MGKHADWRKIAKKTRRKRYRSELAVARDKRLEEEQAARERSPGYRAWLREQEALSEWQAEEERRLAMQRQQAYQTAEETALLRWREQQSRIQQAKAEKFKRECMIKEEWEREQRKQQIAEEVRKRNEDEKRRKQAELMAQIDAFIEGKADFPEEVNVSTQTQPGLPDCPFFSKTGACRFRDSCSRNHIRPGISRTLLIPNFYDHIGLSTLNQAEYDTDLGLEYEDSETYQHFKEFYGDVLPEFEECGRVVQFKVCTNEEPHLRGNVYVEFFSRRQALKAYRTFQGRFYAGRRLNVEFTTIPSWKNAVCGLYHRQKCPKGKTCNFLHVFRNPENAFKISDGTSSRRQVSRSRSRTPARKQERTKEWNWSDGSGSETESKRKRSRSRSKGRSRRDSSRERRKKRSRERRRDRKRSRSKSRERKRSKSKDRKRSKSKDRKRSRSRSRDRKRHKDESKKKDRKDKSKDNRSKKESNEEESSKKIKDRGDKSKLNSSDVSEKGKKEESGGKSSKREDGKSRRKDREEDKRKGDDEDHTRKKHITKTDSTKTSGKVSDSTKTNVKEKKEKEEERDMRNEKTSSIGASASDSESARAKVDVNSGAQVNGKDS